VEDSKNLSDESIGDLERKAKEIEFLKDELDHVESLEEIVDELEEFALEDLMDEDEEQMIWSEEALSEIFGDMTGDQDDDDVDDDEIQEEETFTETYMDVSNVNDFRRMEERIRLSAAESLEQALLQGVVPVSAGVGTETLPGDYGFDPLQLAKKDYFRQVQRYLVNMLPGGSDSSTAETDRVLLSRPKALILRDLREAEIRHARLGKSSRLRIFVSF
jgi:hypothetical protein